MSKAALRKSWLCIVCLHADSMFLTIAGLLASEEQKRELLPDMASLKKIGAWGLTEPSNGSDASALQSTARKVGTSKLCTACNNQGGRLYLVVQVSA